MNDLRKLFSGAHDERLLHMAVNLGKVQGWRWLRKFGQNDDVPASGSEEMWPVGTARVLPTSAAVASVVSNSIADDVASTGVRTLTIEGLDEDYLEVSETVDMDGTTPVLTTQTFLRVNRAFAATGGTGETNAGDISISVGGDLQAYIEANAGQTHQTNYTVPAGHTLVIKGYKVGTGRMSGSSDLHVEGEIMLFGTSVWRAISNIYLWDGQIHSNVTAAVPVPEKTEIRQTINSSSTTQCFGIFQGYLIENVELV